MRRKAFPSHRKSLSRCKRVARRTYVISGRAQTVLVAIVEGILEESLEDARKLAGINGKSCVCREEMEKALLKLCLRLNPLSSLSSKLQTDDISDSHRFAFLGNGDGDAETVETASDDKNLKLPEEQ